MNAPNAARAWETPGRSPMCAASRLAKAGQTKAAPGEAPNDRSECYVLVIVTKLSESNLSNQKAHADD